MRPGCSKFQVLYFQVRSDGLSWFRDSAQQVYQAIFIIELLSGPESRALVVILSNRDLHTHTKKDLHIWRAM